MDENNLMMKNSYWGKIHVKLSTKNKRKKVCTEKELNYNKILRTALRNLSSKRILNLAHTFETVFRIYYCMFT